MFGALMVAVVAIVCWCACRYSRRRLHKLAANIPGLKELPVVGHAHRFVGSGEHIMNALKDISYHAIQSDGISKVWMGPVLLFFLVDPADIEYVLRTCLEKDDLHRFIRDLAGNGVVFAPVSIWRQRKKYLVPMFSPAVVESYVGTFSEQCAILSNQLKKAVGDGDVFDLWPKLTACTLDSVSETVMGIKLQAQSFPHTPFMVAMKQLLKTMTNRIFKIWLHPDWLFRLSPEFEKYQASKKQLYKVIDDFIAHKKEELKNPLNEALPMKKTYLEHLISLSSKQEVYSNLEIREEVLSLTVAGTDTTAGTIGFTLMLLGKHQDVQEKVYNELVNIFGHSDREMVKEDLSKLSYLERVIKESLRLYPSAPFIARKIEQEIKLPSGRILPAGCGVGISIWGTHRNPKYWGKDAEDFDPDRFLPDRFNLSHPGAYIAFSSGPRSCVGQQYAMMSVKTALASIIRRYQVNISREDVTECGIPVKMDVTLKTAHGFNVALEEREFSK